MSTRMDKILAEYLIDAAEDWYVREVEYFGFTDSDKIMGVKNMLLDGFGEDEVVIGALSEDERVLKILKDTSKILNSDMSIGSFRRLSCISELIKQLKSLLRECE